MFKKLAGVAMATMLASFLPFAALPAEGLGPTVPAFVPITTNAAGIPMGGDLAQANGGSGQVFGSAAPISEDGRYVVTTGAPHGLIWRDTQTAQSRPFGTNADGSPPASSTGIEYIPGYSPTLDESVEYNIQFDWAGSHRFHPSTGQITDVTRFQNVLAADVPASCVGHYLERSFPVAFSDSSMMFMTECPLTPDDINGIRYDTYLWHANTHQIQLVSKYPNGAHSGNAFSTQGDITPDGRYVVYVNAETATPPTSPPLRRSGYLWDRQTNVRTKIWPLPGTVGLDFSAENLRISPDGSSVAISYGNVTSVLDPNRLQGSMIYNTATGQYKAIPAPAGWPTGVDVRGGIVRFNQDGTQAIINATPASATFGIPRYQGVYDIASDTSVPLFQTGAPGWSATLDVDVKWWGEDDEMIVGTKQALVPSDVNNSYDLYKTAVVTDVTPPVVTGVADRAANSNGWYNEPVTVSWTATDPAPSSGAPTQPSPTLADLEGEDVVYTSAPSCDPENNCATGETTISLDSVAPTGVAAPDRASDHNGWYTAPVTVGFGCEDALSGMAICPSAITLATEGIDQSASGEAIDNADNSALIATAGINIDMSGPTGSATPDREPDANGWYMAPVTFTFTCADALSGIAVCPAPLTVSAQAAMQTITGDAVDQAGNTTTITSDGVSVDSQPPVVVGTPDRDANASGWYNAPVTIGWSASDNVTASISAPSSTNAHVDGENVGYESAEVCDAAGNCAHGSYALSIDTVSPTIEAVADRVPDANGWYQGPVTISFLCGDELSGVVDCPSPIVVGEDGQGQEVGGTATDAAGNTTSVSVEVSVDQTAPSIEAVVSQAPEANGWNNGNVSITFTCADALSGVATCSTPVTLTEDGANQTVVGTVVDNAGNSTTTTVTVSIDQTMPMISAVRTPANGNGWNSGDVIVTFTCIDAQSGIVYCPDAVTLSAEAANQSVSGTVLDEAGNSASVTVGAINIDKTAPTTTLLGPVEGGAYAQNNVPAPNCVSVDSLSGVDVPATAQVVDNGNGSFTATCSGAADMAGNVAAVASVNYTVGMAVRNVATGSRLLALNGSITTAIGSSGDVHIGETITVSVFTDVTSGPISCSDSKGNDYDVVSSRINGNGRLYMCSAVATFGLTSGDTVGATYPGFSGVSVISVNVISAFAASGVIADTSDSAGSTTTPNSGTVTVTSGGHLLFGVVAHTSSATFSPGAGYSVVGSITGGSGIVSRTLNPEYKVVSTSGTYFAGGTLSTARPWAAAVIAY